MPRSAALQMFEQKFRPFTILRCAGASRTSVEDEHERRGEKVDCTKGREATKRSRDQMKNGANRDKTARNKILGGKIASNILELENRPCYIYIKCMCSHADEQ